MHVISRKALLTASLRHSALSAPLDTWYRIAKKAHWRTLDEVRTIFPSADAVGEYTVFNIKGNAFRLIVEINYATGRLYIRNVLTHAEYSKGAWKKVSALAVTPAYTALLVKFPPRIIRSDEQNESCIAALRELEQHHEQWTDEETELAELLTLLIEDYEEKNYRLPPATPVESLQFLIDQHDLAQDDLGELFGTPAIVSEILSGERELNKEHIRRLSERFHVSPELFF